MNVGVRGPSVNRLGRCARTQIETFNRPFIANRRFDERVFRDISSSRFRRVAYAAHRRDSCSDVPVIKCVRDSVATRSNVRSSLCRSRQNERMDQRKEEKERRRSCPRFDGSVHLLDWFTSIVKQSQEEQRTFRANGKDERVVERTVPPSGVSQRQSYRVARLKNGDVRDGEKNGEFLGEDREVAERRTDGRRTKERQRIKKKK